MNSLIEPWEYAIPIFMLSVSIAIGFYFKFSGGKQKTLKEFLFADKSAPVIPTAISLMATYTSGSIFLGMPSETYRFGLVAINIGMFYPICSLLIGNCILPVFFENEISTPFEYLCKRFGYTSQILVSLMCSLLSILYMGVGLYAPSLSLEALIGINELTAVFIIGTICTLYSVLGGMKAVIAADVFQAVLMFLAVISLMISATIDAGGIAPFWEIVRNGKRMNFLSFSVDPTETHTTIAELLGGSVLFLTSHITSQTQVQRYLAVKDLKTAKRALLISSPISTLFLILCGLTGIAIFTKYYDCDPVKSGTIRESDQLFPLYIAEGLNGVPGLKGLMITAIFSGTLSSLSSVLNGLSAATITDYISPFYRKFLDKELSEKTATVLVKVLVIFYGIICMLAAMMAKYLGGVTKGVIQIYGAVGGPVLGFFLLGMFTKNSNQVGALSGYLMGNVITFWMSLGGPKPPLDSLPISTEGCITISYNNTAHNISSAFSINKSDYFWLYRISYLYTGIIGIGVTFMVGFVLSILWSTFWPRFFGKGIGYNHPSSIINMQHLSQSDKLLKSKVNT